MKQHLATVSWIKFFWVCMMICAAGIYLTGCGLLIYHATRLAGMLLLAGVILLHTAELKTAMRIGREHDVPVSRITIMNMLFGFIWRLPLKKGVIS